MLVPCTVESVRVHVLTNQHVVLLQAEGVRRLLPIWIGPDQAYSIATRIAGITSERPLTHDLIVDMLTKIGAERSEEHTSELQSLRHLVCRLLLEKKKKTKHPTS